MKKNNAINWSTDKCSICNFPLKIDPIGPNFPNKTSYGDFFICYEYTFLKNMYSKDELLSAPEIKTLVDYYKTYQKFIRICIALHAIFVSHINFDDLECGWVDRVWVSSYSFCFFSCTFVFCCLMFSVPLFR